MTHDIAKSILYGALAGALLLGVYFTVLSLVSGGEFAWNQFASFWYFIVSLALGFGVQVGLFVYLKNLVRGGRGGNGLGITGTTVVSMKDCVRGWLSRAMLHAAFDLQLTIP